MANENETDPRGEQPIQVWTDWLDRWSAQRPTVHGTDEDGAEIDPTPRRLPTFTVAMISAGVIVVAVMVIAISQLRTIEEPDPFTAAVPVSTQATAETGTAAPTSTSNSSSTPQCDEDDTGDTLTTSKGGEVTSPQTLVAEFQHRYFDLRDGAAVAELWDDGYEAEGFQATIDDSLAELEGRATWCLTVAPAESGWWATEVSWWQQGDQKVRETWYGTYKIERRGSGFIFTDAATE